MTNKEVDAVEGEVVIEETAVDTQQDGQEKSWTQRLMEPSHWLRFIFMVLFVVILSIASYIMVALVVLQFVWALIAGEGNDKLKEFGSSLSQYIYQSLRFLTYNTEDKPFPFSDWPESEK